LSKPLVWKSNIVWYWFKKYEEGLVPVHCQCLFIGNCVSDFQMKLVHVLYFLH